MDFNRTKKDIIYYKELSKFNKMDNIKIINSLTKELPDNWEEEVGRINKDMILKYIKSPKLKLWYVCAPPPMVTATKQILEELDIPKENWHIEDWQIHGKHDKES